MPEDEKPIEIVICLGSSCFARGNAENLRALKTYLEHYNVAAKFSVHGQLCRDKCTIAPTLTIDNKEHNNVKPGGAVALLEQALKERMKP